MITIGWETIFRERRLGVTRNTQALANGREQSWA
jgi:hypothetical protein